MYNTDAKFGFWYSEYTVVGLLVVGGNNTTLFNIQQQSMRKQKALAAAPAATSKYVGISYDASKQRYRAEIYARGKRVHIGYFPDEITAATKYDEYAARMGRPVNFPENYNGKAPEDLPDIPMNEGVRRKNRRKGGEDDHEGCEGEEADDVVSLPSQAPSHLKQGSSLSSTIKGTEGRWSVEEHHRFLEGLDRYGKRWTTISSYVGTRNVLQVRSHAQKYYLKMGSSRQQLERKPEHFLPQSPSSQQEGVEHPTRRPPSHEAYALGSLAATAATLQASSQSALPIDNGRKRKIDLHVSDNSISTGLPRDDADEWSGRRDSQLLLRPRGLRLRRPPVGGERDGGGASLSGAAQNETGEEEGSESSDQSDSDSELSNEDDEDQEVDNDAHDSAASGVSSNDPLNLGRNRRRVAAGFNETIELLEADPLPLPLLAALTTHLRNSAASLLASSPSGDSTAHQDKNNNSNNDSVPECAKAGSGGFPYNLAPSLAPVPQEPLRQELTQESPAMAAAVDRKAREQLLEQKQRGHCSHQDAIAAAQQLQEQQIQEEQIQQFKLQLQQQQLYQEQQQHHHQLQQEQPKQHAEHRSPSHEAHEALPPSPEMQLEQYQQMQMQAAAAQYQAQAVEMQQMLLQAVLSSGGPIPDWAWRLPQAPHGLLHHPSMLHDEASSRGPAPQGAPMGMAPDFAAAIYTAAQPGSSLLPGLPGIKPHSEGSAREFPGASTFGTGWPHR